MPNLVRSNMDSIIKVQTVMKPARSSTSFSRKRQPRDESYKNFSSEKISIEAEASSPFTGSFFSTLMAVFPPEMYAAIIIVSHFKSKHLHSRVASRDSTVFSVLMERPGTRLYSNRKDIFHFSILSFSFFFSFVSPFAILPSKCILL